MHAPIIYTVPEGNGEDTGKQFELSRMSSLKAHNWAVRALLALSRAGVPMPDEKQLINMGMAAMYIFGFQSLGKVEMSEADALLAQLRGCAKIIPDPVGKPEMKRNIMEGDVDEWMTYFLLEKEVFEFHTGFFARAARFNSEAAARAQSQSSNSIPTSPQSSAS